MKTNITIREAKDTDLDAIAVVWHDSASCMDGPTFEMPSMAELRTRIDHELAADWKLYLAERNEMIVGMLALKPDKAILDQIFVLPSEQGTGVGFDLLKFAKRTMPKGFTLRMASANRAAAQFYERADLRVIREGNHPVSGTPVQYFGWNVS